MEALGDVLHEGLHAMDGAGVPLKFFQQFLVR
jgi:hypothetical protein